MATEEEHLKKKVLIDLFFVYLKWSVWLGFWGACSEKAGLLAQKIARKQAEEERRQFVSDLRLRALVRWLQRCYSLKPHDALDIVQEAIAKALKVEPWFIWGESPRAYIKKAVRSAVMEFFRSEKRQWKYVEYCEPDKLDEKTRKSPLVTSPPLPDYRLLENENRVLREERRRAANRAFQALSQRDQEALLFHKKKVPYAEIVREMKLPSEEAARTARSRAWDRLECEILKKGKDNGNREQ